MRKEHFPRDYSGITSLRKEKSHSCPGTAMKISPLEKINGE